MAAWNSSRLAGYSSRSGGTAVAAVGQSAADEVPSVACSCCCPAVGNHWPVVGTGAGAGNGVVAGSGAGAACSGVAVVDGVAAVPAAVEAVSALTQLLADCLSCCLAR